MTEIQIVLNDAAEVVVPPLHDAEVISLKVEDESVTLSLKERGDKFVVNFVGVEQLFMTRFCGQNVILDLLLLNHTNCPAEDLIKSSQRLGLKCDLDTETMGRYENGELIYSILYPSAGLHLQVLSREVRVYQN
ncbi:hypothetical protein JYB88_16785 [Shewanella cyperi]|uniref:Uncharacterized protein n=1 Tax=Shewanella cyperi TaxID=2814292 RepID=A0A975AJY8_9GAMM|nr:hypothetical protein [Shewanella cyperi]QSX29817.1 hypothetical protein JYB88_16785 [Shewanella cyperi]